MLRINLDETACRLHCDQKRGLAVSRQRALSRAKKREIVQDVSRGKLRGCFTLIAMICDDASLQPLLPQILLGNEHIFQQRVLDGLRPSLPVHAALWRLQAPSFCCQLPPSAASQLLLCAAQCSVLAVPHAKEVLAAVLWQTAACKKAWHGFVPTWGCGQ